MPNVSLIASNPSPGQALPDLARAFRSVRAHTEALAACLSPEDQCVQSMPDASPAKWHRAHSTWFFEQFVAAVFIAGYRPVDPRYQFLFNSYYEAVGARHPRPTRGLITRPGADEVSQYRAAVDSALLIWMQDNAGDHAARAEAARLIELGLHHEQQHQELLLTDILHAFAQNPLAPAALPAWREPSCTPGEAQFIDMPGGIAAIGARRDSTSGFCFDNETPHHRVLLPPYRLASRLVTNANWLAFMQDGGYRTASLWMSDGWDRARTEAWHAPLHWREDRDTGAWTQMTPAGLLPLDPKAPVRHISWYEADAFARWAGARLPTEAEMEVVLAAPPPGMADLIGHVWQWTGSAYLPYPGFRPEPGAVGEYNGKFMINQMVLRGSSMATPPGHCRPTYRNFFPPEKRWQFTGVRLARD
jgi:ergothioneine biosynthesis protein EgtB